MTETTLHALCQVRSKTESTCPRRAVVTIREVAFCGPCAREQEAYLAIGELTQEAETHGSGGNPLFEALQRLRRERAGGPEDNIAVGTHHRFPVVDETEHLALTGG